MPHWNFLKATTGTGAMAASATISVTRCACHLKGAQGAARGLYAKNFTICPTQACNIPRAP
eukprot:scaffold73616_cov42-Phaeocystis_antarctica.AAC.1